MVEWVPSAWGTQKLSVQNKGKILKFVYELQKNHLPSSPKEKSKVDQLYFLMRTI